MSNIVTSYRFIHTHSGIYMDIPAKTPGAATIVMATVVLNPKAWKIVEGSV